MSFISRFRSEPAPAAADAAASPAAADAATSDAAASPAAASPAAAPAATDPAATPAAPTSSTRRILTWALTAAAAALVYLALVVPDSVVHHKAGAHAALSLFRLPLEGIVGAAVLIVLPGRLRKIAAILLGLGLGSLTVLKIINAGFLDVLGRRFNPVLDWPLFSDGYNALTETNGRPEAIAAVIGAIVLTVVVLALCTLAVIRLSRVTVRHALPARRALIALGAVWVALALTGVQLFPNSPVAARSVVALAKTTVLQVPAALRDQRNFATASKTDAFKAVPPAERLGGLTGKDFVIGVVESYGRSSITDPAMSAIVTPVLSAGAKTLAAAGFHAKSGFLTSSTYGGGSWLAHGSFQSGLWINSQQRYRQLTASDRLTLTSAFHEGGWKTVGMEPGNTVAWPEAKFYGYDTVYDSRNMGYAGPRFGWSRMPDQYTLAQFQKDVYGKQHPPTMAEITMTSSHEPWTPIPQTVDWNAIGDGKIYAPMAHSAGRTVLWKSPTNTQAEYAKSIAYSVNSLVSWVQKYGHDNLVLVFFGDHQPIPLVSGVNSSHDVPITIVAHDPKVLDRIADWGWQDGLKPNAQAPVWQMSSFRDKFFSAFGTEPGMAR